VSHLEAAENVTTNNPFDSAVQLSESDFQSLDENQLQRTRQPNGDLPVVTFFLLVHATDRGAFAQTK
jgi:hypothetical protein